MSSPRKKRVSPAVMVAIGAVVCIGSAWLGVVTVQPYTEAAHRRAENDALERQVLRYRQENQHLQLEVRSLSTRHGIMLAGRREGLVMPGEVHLRIPER